MKIMGQSVLKMGVSLAISGFEVVVAGSMKKGFFVY